MFKQVFKNVNLGLFILRLGIGIMFMVHGFDKMFPVDGDYIGKWTWLGSRMNLVGVTFAPAFFGFMAAVAEFFGGVFLILGLFTRVWSWLLAFTMFIAMLHHLQAGDGISGASHAIELMVVFVGLAIIGPAKLSLDYLFFKKK